MIRVPIQVNDRTIYTVDIQRSVYATRLIHDGPNVSVHPDMVSDYRWRVFIGEPKPEYQSLVQAGWATHRYGDGAVVLVAKVMDMIDEKEIQEIMKKERA